MKTPQVLLSAAMLAAMFTSDAAAQGRNPGSVLFYPIHRSGASYFTVVSVTNTNTTPKTLVSFGGGTMVHFQYVNVVPNPMNPFMPLACTIFDRSEYLTPADTLSVLTGCHNAVAPRGQEGYLVVNAENPERYRTPWSHNHLIGSELVVNAQGAAYALLAIPFSSPVAAGAPTDLDADGKLDFNNAEYSGTPDILSIDSFIALAGSQLSLTNMSHTSDSDINTVYFSVWNDNEFPMSATLEFSCWFDQPLSIVSPLFSEAFLRSVPNDPSELDITCDGRGDLETGWATIQSLGVRTTGGLPISINGVVVRDGALLGSISTGPLSGIQGAKLLWESVVRQVNAEFGH